MQVMGLLQLTLLDEFFTTPHPPPHPFCPTHPDPYPNTLPFPAVPHNPSETCTFDSCVLQGCGWRGSRASPVTGEWNGGSTGVRRNRSACDALSSRSHTVLSEYSGGPTPNDPVPTMVLPHQGGAASTRHATRAARAARATHSRFPCPTSPTMG